MTDDRQAYAKLARRAIEQAKRLKTEIVFEVPEGYRRLKGAQTQPNGTYWAGRGSLFDGTHEHVLVWQDYMREAAMEVQP